MFACSQKPVLKPRDKERLHTSPDDHKQHDKQANKKCDCQLAKKKLFEKTRFIKLFVRLSGIKFKLREI